MEAKRYKYANEAGKPMLEELAEMHALMLGVPYCRVIVMADPKAMSMLLARGSRYLFDVNR